MHACSLVFRRYMGDESIAMVFAEVERVAEPRSESTEFIESFLLPRAEVRRFCARIAIRFLFVASWCLRWWLSRRSNLA